jgi:hypothetical protein
MTPSRRPKPHAPSPGVLTSIRLTADVVARADALLPRLDRDPAITAVGAVTRAVALRLALVLGLDALERKYPEETKR